MATGTPDPRKVRAGEAIRQARKQRGLKQDDFAEALSRALAELTALGSAATVKQSAVSRWEMGENAPDQSKWTAIEDVLLMQHGTLAEILLDRPRPARAPAELLTTPRAILGELRRLVEALDELLPPGDGPGAVAGTPPALPLRVAQPRSRRTGTRNTHQAG